MKYTLKYGEYVGEYLHEFNQTINSDPQYYRYLKDLLRVKQTKFPKVRIGNPGDGGYVMLDNFNSRIAYSFGIDENISWDADMYQRGYDIFMYDPTVDFKCDSPKLHFYKEGIDGYNHGCYKTLSTILRENNHRETMILKMDVEGYEWNFIETVGEEINLFDQIAFEFHNLISGDTKILDCLEKLNKTHQVIHVHGNNSSLLLQTNEFTITDVIECTYVKRDYELFDCSFSIPTELDYPNDIGRPDVIMEWN